MKQAQIQQLRRLLAEEITGLHAQKRYLKADISTAWKLSTPDTDLGKHAFWLLNRTKGSMRYITKRIDKLSTLIKELKREERKSLGH
jgi:hypothetical protein